MLKTTPAATGALLCILYGGFSSYCKGKKRVPFYEKYFENAFIITHFLCVDNQAYRDFSIGCKREYYTCTKTP